MNTTTTLLATALLGLMSAPAQAGDVCDTIAKLQYKAALLELKEDYKVGQAACLNITDSDDYKECLAEAKDELKEGRLLAEQQLMARLELCDKLGGGVYAPEIDPQAFDNPIDNAYLPFPVGATWTYEGDTEDGLEIIVIEVLPDTREIMGVECVTVRDTVTIGGDLVEDTYDWYAQDDDGNVWYFGEISFNYADEWVEDIDGSWLAGVDGALPGIVMHGTPVVGTTYRQEYWLGEAEDAATTLDVDASVTIGLGTFTGCIQTEDFLPPEPDALENKFYAPGIGFLYETKPGEDETLELVSYNGL